MSAPVAFMRAMIGVKSSTSLGATSSNTVLICAAVAKRLLPSATPRENRMSSATMAIVFAFPSLPCMSK